MAMNKQLLSSAMRAAGQQLKRPGCSAPRRGEVIAWSPAQPLSPEALGKSLRILRVGEAKDHKVQILAMEGVRQRRCR